MMRTVSPSIQTVRNCLSPTRIAWFLQYSSEESTPLRQLNQFVLTVTVVTFNEESNLRRCLSSLDGLANEIVVVDSGSSDGTQAVADEFGAKWYHLDWQGFRDQKNYALQQATQPWVLCLDADEELSEALQGEIAALLAGDDPAIDGASFPASAASLGAGFATVTGIRTGNCAYFDGIRGNLLVNPGTIGLKSMAL